MALDVEAGAETEAELAATAATDADAGTEAEAEAVVGGVTVAVHSGPGDDGVLPFTELADEQAPATESVMQLGPAAGPPPFAST